MCCAVKTCCCGMTLKKGITTFALILGIIGLLLSKVFDCWPFLLAVHHEYFPYAIGVDVSVAVGMITTALLLLAKYDRTKLPKLRRRLMLPWLVFTMLSIVVLAVAAVAFLATGAQILDHPFSIFQEYADRGVGFIAAGFLCSSCVLIGIYYWTVVHRNYRELLIKQDGDEIPTNIEIRMSVM